MTQDRYTDRRHAGRVLADGLADFRHHPNLLVLALPRGGVPVAAEIARVLKAPLDVVVVRKVGVPRQPEVAMGALAAIAGTIEVVVNPDVLRHVQSEDAEAFDRVAERERAELTRRQHAYRGERPAIDVTDRTVVLVDDGIATGATMRAAIAAVTQQRPARLVVAVPVAPREACTELRAMVDDVVCPWTPEPFWAVGQAYIDFSQTSDAEVLKLLNPTAPETDE